MTDKLRRAAIVNPVRTGVGKFQGALSPFQAGDLGALVLKALVERPEAPARPLRRAARQPVPHPLA